MQSNGNGGSRARGKRALVISRFSLRSGCRAEETGTDRQRRHKHDRVRTCSAAPSLAPGQASSRRGPVIDPRLLQLGSAAAKPATARRPASDRVSRSRGAMARPHYSSAPSVWRRAATQHGCAAPCQDGPVVERRLLPPGSGPPCRAVSGLVHRGAGLRRAGREGLDRMRNLGATRSHLESHGLFTARRNLPFGFVQPIIEGIGFVERRPVLLDSSAQMYSLGSRSRARLQ